MALCMSDMCHVIAALNMERLLTPSRVRIVIRSSVALGVLEKGVQSASHVLTTAVSIGNTEL